MIIKLNRAKKAVFFSSERAQIKTPGLGQTILAPTAHLLAQTGYFYSAWFSLGNDSRPTNTGISLNFARLRRNHSQNARVQMDLAPEGGLRSKF